MIAGHFGFAAMVKARERQAPLWALMLATVWLDIVFIPLLLTGIEGMSPVPGLRGGYGENIIHADYTHSLVGALLLSAAFAIAYLPRWGQRCALVLGAVSFSHWLLDLITHRQDMPWLPGNVGQLPRLGFGLWQMRLASIVTELALVMAGAFFYWRAARSVAASSSRDRNRAVLIGVLIGVCGVVILGLDVSGALG